MLLKALFSLSTNLHKSPISVLGTEEGERYYIVIHLLVQEIKRSDLIRCHV